MCQMVMTKNAIRPSFECATFAAGMISPGMIIAAFTGKNSMNPVRTMITLPATRPQYSNFSL